MVVGIAPITAALQGQPVQSPLHPDPPLRTQSPRLPTMPAASLPWCRGMCRQILSRGQATYGQGLPAPPQVSLGPAVKPGTHRCPVGQGRRQQERAALQRAPVLPVFNERR